MLARARLSAGAAVAAAGAAWVLLGTPPAPQVALLHVPDPIGPGRVEVRLGGSLAVEALWVMPATAPCVIYAPPGRIWRSCADPRAPWRHCPHTLVHLDCAAAQPGGATPLLQLGLPVLPPPPAVCAVNGLPVHCWLDQALGVPVQAP
jgi:hypothetical protein